MDLSLLGMLSAAGGGSSSSKKADGNPVVLDGLQGGVPFNRVEVSGKNLLTGIINLYPTTKNNFAANSNAISVYAKCNPNTTYTIQRNGGSRLQCMVTQTLPSNGTTYSNLTVAADQTANTITYTTPDNCNYIVAYLAGNAEEITDIQIEEGSTPTEYEPPITGREMTVGVSGKNLLKYPFANTSKTVNGITFTDNGDGSITVNGTATETVYFSLSSNKALPTGKYVLGKSMDNILIYVDKYLDNTFYQRVATSTVTVKELIFNVSDEDAQKYTYKFGIQFNKGNIADNVTIYPQLELGDTATEFELYHGAEYTITPDSNPYTVPVDITQQDGINVLSISDVSNPTISVNANKASEQLSKIYSTLDNKPVLIFDGDVGIDKTTPATFAIPEGKNYLMLVPMVYSTQFVYDVYGCMTMIDISSLSADYKEFPAYGISGGNGRATNGYIAVNDGVASVYFMYKNAGGLKAYAI